MLTEENKRERKTGIGASEITAVVGLSPWGSPLSIYERKVSPPAEEPEQTVDMERGTFLERGILEWTAHRRGIVVVPNRDLVRHPDHTFVTATPDGYEIDGKPNGVGGRRVGVVEVKAPRKGIHWTHPDEDPAGIPAVYFAQVQYQMLACRLPRAIVAALIYGEPWIYDVHADADLQAALLDAAAQFWARVEARDPPAPTAPGDAAVFGRLVDQRRKNLVEPASVEEAAALARAFKAAQAAEKEAEAEAERLKGQLVALIGDAAGLDLGEQGPMVTWKKSKDGCSVAWEKIAREAGAADELIAKHTTVRQGSRRFLVTLPKEEK